MNRNNGKIFQLISARLAGKSGAPNWRVIFLFFTFIGIMNFNRFYTNELAEGDDPNCYHYFINEMTGAYVVMALLPLLFYFFRKFPLQRDNWRRHLPLYLLANVALGFCHTMLMFLRRKAIYALALQMQLNRKRRQMAGMNILIVDDEKPARKKLRAFWEKEKGAALIFEAGNSVEAARLISEKGAYLMRETMINLEARLDPSKFVRIHRSYLVNVDFIKELQPESHGDYLARLKNGVELPVSRRFRERLMVSR